MDTTTVSFDELIRAISVLRSTVSYCGCFSKILVYRGNLIFHTDTNVYGVRISDYTVWRKLAHPIRGQSFYKITCGEGGK